MSTFSEDTHTHLGLKQTVALIGQQARQASNAMAHASTQSKNNCLSKLAELIATHKHWLKEQNALDLTAAKDLDDALLDRLRLSDNIITQMIDGLHQVSILSDPIGEISEIITRPSGIQVGKMRSPLGVIAMIYESRPNVTIEASSLALKSGNAIILRGGKEAFYSNQALTQLVQQALRASELPSHTVQMIPSTDRAAVTELIRSPQWIDLAIPRGGSSLVNLINQEARVPVIKHLHGNCHVYVDEFADLAMALEVVENAKTQRYGTCNTAESLLVDQPIAQDFLAQITPRFAAKNVEMRVDTPNFAWLTAAFPQASIKLATEADWSTEYLAPVISIKLIEGITEAIAHINQYGSHHTDAIITQHHAHAMRFLHEVDSAVVMVNTSTRFADGFEFGLGAEIGISTDKFHARGPVGIYGLTSQKWIVLGHGEIHQ